MRRNYDKYTYSHRRNHSEKERSFVESTTTPVGVEPATSVLNPLRPSCHSFAVAEDGVLHSRLVAPPRICYAPVIQELDAPAMPATALERLRRVLRISSSAVKSEQRGGGPEEQVDGDAKKIQADLALASQEWQDISDALAMLERQDLDKEEQLMVEDKRAQEEFAARSSAAAASEQSRVSSDVKSARGAQSPVAAAAERAALQKQWEDMQRDYLQRKQWLEQERISPVDWAKIELIWKKSRAVFGASPGQQQAAVEKQRVVAKMARENSASGMVIDEESLLKRLKQEELQKKRNVRQKREGSNTTTSNNTSRASSAARRASSPRPGAAPTASDEDADAAIPGRGADGTATSSGYSNAQLRSAGGGAVSGDTSTSRAGSMASSSVSAARPRSAGTSHRRQQSQQHQQQGRFTIFNEKLHWNARSKVDSNNYAW